MVSGLSIRVGGDALDEAIARFIRRNYNLMIGERSAEELKISLGSAFPLPEELSGQVRGRDQITGLPKTIKLTSEEMREALKEPVGMMINAIRQVVERTPPELVSDIMNKEITMTGGGSLLRGLDQLISSELGMKVNLADDPMACVVLGAGKTLENLDVLKRVLVEGNKR